MYLKVYWALTVHDYMGSKSGRALWNSRNVRVWNLKKKKKIGEDIWSESLGVCKPTRFSHHHPPRLVLAESVTGLENHLRGPPGTKIHTVPSQTISTSQWCLEQARSWCKQRFYSGTFRGPCRPLVLICIPCTTRVGYLFTFGLFSHLEISACSAVLSQPMQCSICDILCGNIVLSIRIIELDLELDIRWPV